jgi:hypothetical protein
VVELLQEGIILQQLLTHSLWQAITTVELQHTHHTACMSKRKRTHAWVNHVTEGEAQMSGARVISAAGKLLLLQLLLGQETLLLTVAYHYCKDARRQSSCMWIACYVTLQ